MSTAEFALNTGSILFAAWMALFTGLIALWLWSRIGAPMYARYVRQRDIAKRAARLQLDRRPVRIATSQAAPLVSVEHGPRTKPLRMVPPERAHAPAQRPGVSPRWKADNRVVL